MLLELIGIGFLGGIILNLMPCILPVISLKILNFVKMGDGNKGEILKHGLLYSAGILLSMMTLAGIIILVQLGGGLIGWGFQFQSMAFCGLMAGLMTLFGLHTLGLLNKPMVWLKKVLLGSFSITDTGSQRISKWGKLGSSFGQGILTTIIGSACCGPFLGYAMGLALTLPSLQAIAVFCSIGLGLAAPYLFFSIFPKYLKIIPKPGRWVNILKISMGILMLATSGWFIWLMI